MTLFMAEKTSIMRTTLSLHVHLLTTGLVDMLHFFYGFRTDRMTSLTCQRVTESKTEQTSSSESSPSSEVQS